jgi:hypothetical protein
LGRDIFKVLQLRIIHPRPTSQLWAIFTPSHQNVGESRQWGRNVSLPTGRQAKILSSGHPCPILVSFSGRVMHHMTIGILIELGEIFYYKVKTCQGKNVNALNW